jgi:hypothetical protein
MVLVHIRIQTKIKNPQEREREKNVDRNVQISDFLNHNKAGLTSGFVLYIVKGNNEKECTSNI